MPRKVEKTDRQLALEEIGAPLASFKTEKEASDFAKSVLNYMHRFFAGKWTMQVFSSAGTINRIWDFKLCSYKVSVELTYSPHSMQFTAKVWVMVKLPGMPAVLSAEDDVDPFVAVFMANDAAEEIVDELKKIIAVNDRLTKLRPKK
jgi:hypothetical protein